MKKKILIIALAVICMSIIGYGTYAWLTVRSTVRNVITTGGIDIAVLEEQSVDGQLLPYPITDSEVMPGTDVSKIVRIQNNEMPAYIRAKYKIVIMDAYGNIMDVSAEEISKIITVDIGSDRWSEKDGWWYYNSQLDVGDITEPFIETVSFSAKNMGNEYQNSIIKIVIHAHAVQAANNPAPNGNTADVKGWPSK